MSARACLRRLQREIAQAQSQGISPTVLIAPRSSDITTIDALIIGPADTPYDGAMLHFRINVPSEYPLKPPQVRFMNTDGGTLRIHPQLYSDGKVCLSILGTWHGPRWTASQSLSTVLLSIQSLLNQEPLRCEPGLEGAPQDAVDKANVFVVHEVTRVLIVRALSGKPSWGKTEDAQPLTAAMLSHLSERRSSILKRLDEMSAKYDKQVLREPFVFSAPVASRRYDFAALAEHLRELLPGSGPPPPAVPPPPAPAAAADSPGAAPSRGPPRTAGREDVPEEGSGSDREGVQAHCRICHQTAEESSEPLIVPCRCAGSIQYAHAKCIIRWLEYSGQAVLAKYRCDICRAKFRVTLGGGKSPGYTYLQRDVEIFDDPGFDAPGLVAAIFISFMQTLTTTLGRVLAQSIHACGVIMCTPFPVWIGGYLLVAWQVPVLVIEAITIFFYLFLLCVKGAVICWGPQWRPVDWGNLAEDRIGYVLRAVADNLFALGFRLDGVIVLAVYFSVTHICNTLCGSTIFGIIVRGILGEARAQHLLAFNLGLKELFPAFQALFPRSSSVVGWYLQIPVGLISLLLNLCAIAGLLRRAFLDPRPVPVDVLPAPAPAAPSGTRRKLVSQAEAD